MAHTLGAHTQKHGLPTRNGALGLVIGLLAAVALSANAQTFHKTKMIDAKGKELPVDLVLDKDKQLLTVKVAVGSPIEQIPYATIEKLSYEKASHHRVKQGAVVMIFSLGGGAALMLTKEKFHWFYVDYKNSAAETRTLTLKLDKKEYKQVLNAATDQTGKPVETLKKT